MWSADPYSPRPFDSVQTIFNSSSWVSPGRTVCGVAENRKGVCPLSDLPYESNLSTTFKRETGLTMQEWRQ